MNVLLIGPASEKDSHGEKLLATYRDIFDTSGKELAVELTVATTLLDEILIYAESDNLRVHDGRNNQDLSAYDVVVVRGHGFGSFVDVMATITLYAKQHGIKMINEYSTVRDVSKLLQNVHFQQDGMKIPRTLYVNKGLFEHQDWVEWRFPSVMKLVDGSMGKGNYVVNSWEDVKQNFTKDLSGRYILQEFIPNDGDYRLLFAGDELLAFKRTGTSESHVNNTSQGGSAELVDVTEIPRVIIEQAQRISRQYGMTISGVDVMKHKETGDFYFLEVNMQPQLATGAFPQDKQALVTRLLKSLNQ